LLAKKAMAFVARDDDVTNAGKAPDQAAFDETANNGEGKT